MLFYSSTFAFCKRLRALYLCLGKVEICWSSSLKSTARQLLWWSAVLRDSLGWKADFLLLSSPSPQFSWRKTVKLTMLWDSTVNVLRIKIIQPGNYQYFNVDQFPNLVQPKKLCEHAWALSEGVGQWWQWVNGWKGTWELLQLALPPNDMCVQPCSICFFIILYVFVWNLVKKEEC